MASPCFNAVKRYAYMFASNFTALCNFKGFINNKFLAKAKFYVACLAFQVHQLITNLVKLDNLSCFILKFCTQSPKPACNFCLHITERSHPLST